MKPFRTLPFVLLLSVSITSAILATDYRPDTAFPDLGFTFGDTVYDVYVHPDGRFTVAGQDVTGASSTPFIRRYLPNGTIDSSFVSGTASMQSSSDRVTDIVKVYPNGTYVIRGSFNAQSFFASWLRLNADGSLDSTLPATTRSADLRGAQDDGKLFFCGPVTQNGTTYNNLIRRNSDLSFDTTFRITFADPGVCPEARVQADGKILVYGEFTVSGQPVKNLLRLNSDGSVDQTFDAAINAGVQAKVLSIRSDGKILVGSNAMTFRLLNPDGSQAMVTSTCTTSFAIPLSDGSFLADGCTKFPGGSRIFKMLRIKTDGTPDQTMDWNDMPSGFDGIKGFREDGNGGLYIYGFLASMDGFSRRSFIRAIPNTTPKRNRFDFDGDGKADIVVYRPSEGVWYLNQSSAGFAYKQWGLPTDKLAVNDADEDGKTDIGVFRDGAWHTFTSGSGIHYYQCLGTAGDLPLVGYKEESGRVRNLYISRGSRSGNIDWFVYRFGWASCWNSPPAPSPNVVPGELGSDKPIVGDFNGDSLDDIGFYRNGFWYGTDSENVAAPTSIQWGIAGDILVPADYDGDRQDDYAVFRPSTGDWWINRSTQGAIAVHFGLNGDIPVPADYDGDGKADIAIYRNGAWWQFLSSNGAVQVVNWGLAGDIPVPAQAQF